MFSFVFKDMDKVDNRMDSKDIHMDSNYNTKAQNNNKVFCIRMNMVCIYDSSNPDTFESPDWGLISKVQKSYPSCLR